VAIAVQPTLNQTLFFCKPGCKTQNLFSYLIQLIFDSASNPLFNFAFTFGLFPDALKIAKAIPIYNVGAKPELNNYTDLPLFCQHFLKF